jgi:hypothetical protein
MFVDGALNVLLKNLTQLAFVKKIIKLLVCWRWTIFLNTLSAESDDIALKQSVHNIAKRKAKFKRGMSWRLDKFYAILFKT